MCSNVNEGISLSRMSGDLEYFGDECESVFAVIDTNVLYRISAAYVYIV